MLEPLRDVPALNDRAYRAIKDAILTLQIKPGQLVATNDLAHQLGISRTPVRDALLRLEKEGLVTVAPRKGVYVTPLSAQDVLEVFELRVLLESYAARVAALRLTAEDYTGLDNLLSQSEAAFRDGEEIRAADVGRKIHDLLVSKVGNRRMVVYLDNLDTHYTRIRHFAVMLPGRFERSHEQHKEIVAALRCGNGELAGEIMTTHLQSVRDEVLAHIDMWMPSS